MNLFLWALLCIAVGMTIGLIGNCFMAIQYARNKRKIPHDCRLDNKGEKLL